MILTTKNYAFVLFIFCATCASFAQTFKSVLNFNGTKGAGPQSVLVQGVDGNFYGTTKFGGTNSAGTIFRITPSGKLTTLYSFCSQTYCYDGAFPVAGLVRDKKGNFYGTTWGGGTVNAGTIFRITPHGSFSTLYNFCVSYECPDGAGPYSALILAKDGNLYGTTAYGGTHGYDGGTVFKSSLDGTLTTLYSFCAKSNCTDGLLPIAGLALSSDGDFYGTTYYGGSNCVAQGGCGTAFKITRGGKLTTLYNFCHKANCRDGQAPAAGLTGGGGGIFYGTTVLGGVKNHLCSNGCGTVFQITATSKLTTLHSFNGADGNGPYSGLLHATDGNLYGTTYLGGSHGAGTIFKVTSGGGLQTLHDFDTSDGNTPQAGLSQAADGSFYGTTFSGGTHDLGTIFNISAGIDRLTEK